VLFRTCANPEESGLKINTEKIVRAVLALLYFGFHEDWRACKGFD